MISFKVILSCNENLLTLDRLHFCVICILISWSVHTMQFTVISQTTTSGHILVHDHEHSSRRVRVRVHKFAMAAANTAFSALITRLNENGSLSNKRLIINWYILRQCVVYLQAHTYVFIYNKIKNKPTPVFPNMSVVIYEVPFGISQKGLSEQQSYQL